MDTITEEELRLLETERKTLATHKEEVARLAKRVEAAEQSIIDRLKAGATCIGAIKATIRIEIGRITPKWKEQFLALASRVGLNPKTEEARVVSETKPSEKEKLDLIEEP